MVPDRWHPAVAWMVDVGRIILGTLAILLGLFGTFLLPIGVLVLIEPVVSVPCLGVASCVWTLALAGLLGLGCGIAVLAWASRRGTLALPSAW